MGGPGNCSLLKRFAIAHMHATFFPLFIKLGGPPKVGGPDPKDPVPTPGSAPSKEQRVWTRLGPNVACRF